MPDPGLMQSIGALGYLATSLSYAILAFLMLIAWIRRRGGGLLVAACSLSAFWGLILAGQSAGLPFRPEILFFVEILRVGGWLTFLVLLLSRVGGPLWLRFGALASWPCVLLAGLAPGGPAGAYVANIVMYGGLGLALTGLILLEQIYRNTPTQNRASLKPLALGVGGIFAFDLFLYSQAALFNYVDATTWLARGAVNVVFVPMIALAARRNPTWKLDIFVSRQVVFYSTTLVAVGVYLVLMSLGGYLLIQFGGSWGSVARVVFYAGSLAVLLALLFSSGLRARARVFLSKHFFRNKYDYREEWLRLLKTLSKFEGSSTRENAVLALAQIVESPAGGLWLLDRGREHYRLVATIGVSMKLPDLDADDALVAFMRKDGWLVDLREYREDPAVYGGLELPVWLEAIDSAWLVVPLMLETRLYGLVLLVNAPHTPALNFEDRDLLKTVGSHVAVHLAQEQSDELLSEAQQFEAYNRLTAFLMHDLNNLIAQQSLIVSNAEKHRRNPEFVDDAIATIAGSVQRMKSVMGQLRHGGWEKSKKRTELRFLVSRAVDRCADRKPEPQLVLTEQELPVEVEATEFVSVLSNLIKNAQEATPADGEVRIIVRGRDAQAIVEVQDTGSGMTEDFVRKRLFKPFDSTKGSQGMGIGVYHAREFMQRLGGDLRVASEVGRGTTMTLEIPVVAQRGRA